MPVMVRLRLSVRWRTPELTSIMLNLAMAQGSVWEVSCLRATMMVLRMNII